MAGRICGSAGMCISQGCFACPSPPPPLCLRLPHPLPLPPSPSSTRVPDLRLRPERPTCPGEKSSRPPESKQERSQGPPGEVDIVPLAWEGLSSATTPPCSPTPGIKLVSASVRHPGSRGGVWQGCWVNWEYGERSRSCRLMDRSLQAPESTGCYVLHQWKLSRPAWLPSQI